MLASEVSYVMSEMTAKAGKASHCGWFLKDCLLKVAKINLSREKGHCRLCSQDELRKDHGLDANSSTAATFLKINLV